MHVQPLVPWRSTLPLDIPSFGFAGRSTTAACSVMLAGPALSAFAIFHSSECADVVNVPGGNGAVAEERSSAKAVEEIATNPITAKRVLLHKNLLVPAGRVLASLRNVGPLSGYVTRMTGILISYLKDRSGLNAQGLTGRRHQRLPSVPALVASSPPLRVKLQLSFQRLRLGNKADDAAAISHSRHHVINTVSLFV